jgi:hypothetical protein
MPRYETRSLAINEVQPDKSVLSPGEFRKMSNSSRSISLPHSER